MSFYCDGEERTPLPSKNIDTGAGLERNAAVLLFESEGWDKNKLPSCYDTDLFQPIIRRIEELSGKQYGSDEATDRAIRIVAEHARAVTFLIGDERTPVTPSNEERGYVVRRMLRRAVYFGRRQLGIEQPFMTEMADTVIDTMAPSYEELERQRSFVKGIIAPEERRFDDTLARGLELLDGATRKEGHRTAVIRRRSVPSARHLWVPAGAHKRDRRRPRPHGRSIRIPAAHGATTRARTRRSRRRG